MSKILALRDLAERTIKGQIPTVEQSRSMDDEDIIAKMVEVRGIGRWTAEMFLIFTLGRPDVFPSGDFGIRKGFTVLYGLADLPAPKELEGKSEIWVPYRSVASWYLWQLANDPTIVTRFR